MVRSQGNLGLKCRHFKSCGKATSVCFKDSWSVLCELWIHCSNTYVEFRILGICTLGMYAYTLRFITVLRAPENLETLFILFLKILCGVDQQNISWIFKIFGNIISTSLLLYLQRILKYSYIYRVSPDGIPHFLLVIFTFYLEKPFL